MSKTAGVLALVLVMLAVSPVAAQAQSVVSDQVSPLSTAFSSQRKIVRDSSGNLFVVYLKQVSNVSVVHLSESSDNGFTWKDLGPVSHSDRQAARTMLAIDRIDELHIFWTEFVEEYGQIFYRVYDHGIWSQIQQLTSGEAYSGYPSAAIDSSGRIHLVWYGFDGEAYQVFYVKYDKGNWTRPLKLSQGYPDSVNPAVAVDSHDRVHVVWYKSNGRQYQINYIEWDGNWGRQTILSFGPEDAFNPTIAVDNADRVYVAWDQGEGTRTRIYHSVRTDGVWSIPLAITSDEPGAENPSVAIDSGNRVYILFDKNDGQIYRLTYANGKWSPEDRVTPQGDNSFPSVRWSYHNNPSNGLNGTLDYVWVSKQGGIAREMYGRTPLEGLSSITLYSPTMTQWLGLGAVLIISISVLIIVLARYPIFGSRKGVRV